MKLNIQLFGGRGASSKAKERKGFGWANKDGIPVYNGKIDYTGDFSGANLSRMTNKQIADALDKQVELNKKALGESIGDQRTRNGRMNKIFRDARISQTENSIKNLVSEADKRKMPRYEIYDTKTKMVMMSAYTKNMANSGLADIKRTDASLQKSYNWEKLPSYKIRKVTRKSK